jgi:hypothetical protein
MLQLFSIISISCITSGNKVLLNKSNTYLREFIAKWKNIKMFHSIDTTNQFNIQNQYKNLIENANDIIDNYNINNSIIEGKRISR